MNLQFWNSQIYYYTGKHFTFRLMTFAATCLQSRPPWTHIAAVCLKSRPPRTHLAAICLKSHPPCTHLAAVCLESVWFPHRNQGSWWLLVLQDLEGWWSQSTPVSKNWEFSSFHSCYIQRKQQNKATCLHTTYVKSVKTWKVLVQEFFKLLTKSKG